MEQQVTAYPDILAKWTTAVKKEFETVGRYVVIHIAECAPQLRVTDIRQPKISVASASQVIASVCPLCQAEGVQITPIDPETFKTIAVNDNGALLHQTQCAHRLPIPEPIRQIIMNAAELGPRLCTQQTEAEPL